ncbi:MAG: hypothetical protein ACOYLQ_18370 [Hyphomicrobiaceae bacterium]
MGQTEGNKMRHALGVLGVVAAGILLAVSAAMNWRFGYSLGKTELDGFILGSASAAADCFKALVPFFFFAALRNKMWSQAAASAMVWIVVTGYSLTSALGHAALNRLDTAGQRATHAQSHQDLRNDLERTRSQLSWIPQHRPVVTVQSEIDGLKMKRDWTWSAECTDIKGKQTRDFCQQIQTLTAEHASAQQAAALETRIADIQAKLVEAKGHGTVMTEADPQAAILAKLTGLELGTIQTALVVLVAALLEIGSGLGLYVAFSTWRLYDRKAPHAPSMASLQSPVSRETPAAVAMAKTRSGANDNKSVAKHVAPETDVERFHKEKVETQDGASLTATELYEAYCDWCDDQKKEPLALPTFGREFGELGVQKAKIAGRVRYIGIALKSGLHLEEDKKLLALSSQAA